MESVSMRTPIRKPLLWGPAAGTTEGQGPPVIRDWARSLPQEPGLSYLDESR
ncbi:MAG TPA: hypothetical protein VGI70_13720 [Polyangiales bacterium]